MPKVVDKDAKRRDLVKAAAALFGRDGYAATKIADVARAAGVGKGTMYEYFDSKEDLFWAVCENLVPWPNDVKLFLDHPKTGYARLIRALVSSYEESEGFYPVLLDYWAALVRGQGDDRRFAVADRAPELYVHPRKLIQTVIKAGQDQGAFDRALDPDVIVSLTLAGIEGLRIQRAQDPGHVHFDAAISAFIDAMLIYLDADRSR